MAEAASEPAAAEAPKETKAESKAAKAASAREEKAAKEAAPTIPIVMGASNNPVGIGVAESLTHLEERSRG